MPEIRLSIQRITKNYPTSTDEVREFIWECITTLKIGMGFHPDTFFYDYIFKDGDKKDQQAFTKYEAETLQEHINVCFGLCKKQKADIYAIALGQLDRFVTSSKNNNQPLGKTKHGQSQQFVVDYHPGLGDYLDEKKIRWFAHSNDQIGIFVKDASALFNIALDFHKWHSNVME